jgi:signal peptidase I
VLHSWNEIVGGNVRGASRRRCMLAGMLSLTAVAWLSPLRVGVVRGHSMDPTLHSGQVVALDRAFYRSQPPAVGDVVFFRGEHGVYVKRVYAVAGQMVHLLEERDGGAPMGVPVAPEAVRRLAARLATLPRMRLRRILVPKGMFFALGDAINNSEDSRDFGPVPVERVLGRVLPIGASLAEPASFSPPPQRLRGRAAGNMVPVGTSPV